MSQYRPTLCESDAVHSLVGDKEMRWAANPCAAGTYLYVLCDPRLSQSFVRISYKNSILAVCAALRT